MNMSLLGRIAIIKMNLLPRVMYLLQNLPIIRSYQKLEQWQKKVMRFIWGGGKARIKVKVMCDAQERGGLQVPNFRIYHEAICLFWLSKWINLDNRKLLNLEGFNKKFGWHAYLVHDKAKIDNTFRHHYVRQPLLDAGQSTNFDFLNKYQHG